MRKLCHGFLLTLLFIPVLSAPALACSCPQGSVETARSNADAIFAGTVEDVTYVDAGQQWEPRVIVRFKVARAWKGDIADSFTMHTNVEASSCSGFFRELADPGEVLLVYAHARPARAWKHPDHLTRVVRQDLVDAVADDATLYTTSICTRTRLVLHADEDFRLLGAARELGTLDARPDPAMNGKFPPKPNGLPERCGLHANGHNWKAMAEPPANREALVARLESQPPYSQRQPSPPGSTYRDYWVRTNWGLVGLCRLAEDPRLGCGEVRVAFHRPDDPATSPVVGDIETICNPVKKQ